MLHPLLNTKSITAYHINFRYAIQTLNLHINTNRNCRTCRKEELIFYLCQTVLNLGTTHCPLCLTWCNLSFGRKTCKGNEVWSISISNKMLRNIETSGAFGLRLLGFWPLKMYSKHIRQLKNRIFETRQSRNT